MTAATTEPTESVHEHNGKQWKPLPGCTSTFDELLTSQRRWREIAEETRWNPWRTDELTSESERALQVMGEWTRAEPDFRQLTNRQIGARMGAITRQVRAERRADEARWEQDKQRYDDAREKARYALLERLAINGRLERDLGGYRDGSRSPGMTGDRRMAEISDLERQQAKGAEEIARLSGIVGDPETVVDQDGKLPADRRKWNVIWYGIERRRRVEELRESTDALRGQIADTKDRQGKSTLSTRLWSDERALKALLAVPILEAEDMCADCATPQYQHFSGGDIYESHPCPRWPLFAARMERVWAILRAHAEHPTLVEPVPAKPQPLATLAGNLPIGKVIERLSALQAEHPDAVIRRGRANRWELWPKGE